MRGRSSGPPVPGTESAQAPADAGAEDQAARLRSGRPGAETLPPRERLLRRADYLKCYRTGRRRQGALVALYLVPNALGHPRIGITTSRKVGNSVVRHRLKRWVKEVYRRWAGRRRLSPLDLVAHLKPEAGKTGFGEFRRDLLQLLEGLAGRRERERRMETQG